MVKMNSSFLNFREQSNAKKLKIYKTIGFLIFGFLIISLLVDIFIIKFIPKNNGLNLMIIFGGFLLSKKIQNLKELVSKDHAKKNILK